MSVWEWLTAAAVLMGLEVMAPGAIFIWLAASAACMALLVTVIDPFDWRIQLMVFSVLAVVATYLGRNWIRRNSQPTEEPYLNQRHLQYVGRVLTLSEPIVNGDGRVRVDDSTWKVRGIELPAGTVVRVVDADSAVLIVEPVDTAPP
jgi:inner membrane protein